MFAAVNVGGFDLWTHPLPFNLADLKKKIIIKFNIMFISLLIVMWQTLLAYKKYISVCMGHCVPY